MSPGDLSGGAWSEVVVPVNNNETIRAISASRLVFTITYSATADFWGQLRGTVQAHGGDQNVVKLPSTGGNMSTLSFASFRTIGRSCPGSESQRGRWPACSQALSSSIRRQHGQYHRLLRLAVRQLSAHVSIEAQSSKPVHAPASVTPTTVATNCSSFMRESLSWKRNTR